MLLKNYSQKKKIINKIKTFKGKKKFDSIANFKKMIQKGSSAKKSKSKGKRQTPKKHKSSRKDQIARSKQGMLSRVSAMTGSSNPENMQNEKVLPKTEENETKTESGNEHQCSNRLDGHESKNENTKEHICESWNSCLYESGECLDSKVKELKEIFDKIDKNNDGILTKAEIIQTILEDKPLKNLFLNLLGQESASNNSNRKEILKHFDSMNENNDTTISRNEFIKYFSNYTPTFGTPELTPESSPESLSSNNEFFTNDGEEEVDGKEEPAAAAAE